MYGLSLGVQRMNETLPPPVYALLSGLSASTVGVIALGAVQLAEIAIKDKITRILVIFGACAGVCYNALWYFPVLMIIGGLATFLWDGHFKVQIAKFRARRRRQSHPVGFTEDTAGISAASVDALEGNSSSSAIVQRKTYAPTNASSLKQPAEADKNGSDIVLSQGLPAVPADKDHTIRIRVGIPIIVFFFGKYSASANISAQLNDFISIFTNNSSCPWSAP
jgi:hypothetical protein